MLFEADVTDVRAHLRKMKAGTGASLSLTDFLIRCTAVAAMTDKSPAMTQEYKGTAMLTSVGMFGAGGGHVVPYQDFTLCVGIGGITKKPGIVGDQIEPREFLPITATFDHDIVDGAPAARFAQALKELIENGYGLLD